jgi:predicted dithiol-disulfide oxidoreductase (DUF899 family)
MPASSASGYGSIQLGSPQRVGSGGATLVGADAEIALRRQIEAVAEQRRRLPPGGPAPADYAFTEWDPGASAVRTVHLSELRANGRETLRIYSFMFNPGRTGLRSPSPARCARRCWMGSTASCRTSPSTST